MGFTRFHGSLSIIIKEVVSSSLVLSGVLSAIFLVKFGVHEILGVQKAKMFTFWEYDMKSFTHCTL